MPETHDDTSALRPLTSLDDLETVLAQSSSRPVLIFKHSATCGTSACAHEEIDEWLSEPNAAAADVYVVDVRAHRQVAQAVADRLKVRHQSPQVLLVKDGIVRWHASHASLTTRAIRDALARTTAH
jgi:bacillithiol system protein YtxJ